MTTPTTKPISLNDLYERTECSRCEGSGHYSYCQIHGTTCFKCEGSGRQYTKRGIQTKKYIDSLRTKKVSDLVPGDRIRIVGLRGFQTVIGIEPLPEGYGIGNKYNGVQIDYSRHVKVVQKVGYSICLPEDEFLLQVKTQEEMDRLVEIGRQYQDSLTQSGTVRKNKEMK